jgi:uncharacterized protein YyaL (SSP411 family)
MNKKPNRLINEKSPYLLQHAYNPVDWYPWCDEAFEKAKKEDKPIFLSIGYSSCHWCHVMEKESFEDEEVAKILNENFVSIKVDREERPDIDSIYMNVCLMFNGSGGWPLTIIMTPDKKPFFAGTYFPKYSRPGRIGLVDLLTSVAEYWKNNKEDLIQRAEKVIEYLKNDFKGKSDEISKDIIDACYFDLKSRFDKEYGGFSIKPKFPTPHNIMFSLRYYYHTKETEALKMAEKTLINMRLGGMYDHVGFGFHRYSTDREWLLPHFEKMLYDQAMLTMAYTEAYQLTKNNFYKKTAQETIAYVLRDMTSKEGVFYSSEDADSEGEEGKFYTWTIEELKEVLNDEELSLVIKVFNVKEEGNYLEEATGHLTGRNILYLKKPIRELANDLNMDQDRLETKLEEIRKKLSDAREKRVRPQKDDKVLTDWNGLMISALAKAGKGFEDKDLIEKAKIAADFILNTMFKNDILYHLYKDGEVKVEGLLDDYAFFSWGLIELYEATGDIKYLKSALKLTDLMIEKFYDFENGGFFLSPKNSQDVIVRPKEAFDGAIPSGNSVSAYNLYRLYLISGNEKYYNFAIETLKAFGGEIKRLPSYHSMFNNVLMLVFYPTSEVVLAGNCEKVLDKINAEFIPNKAIVFLNRENEKQIKELIPYTSNMISSDECDIYVCKNFSCNLPKKDLEYALNLMKD